MKAFALLDMPEGIGDKNAVFKRRFYDIVYLIGFLCSLVPGPMPQLTSVASLLLAGCIAICFFDENFYLYMALFIYLRYRLLLGDTPAYRFYSYLVVLKFLIELKDIIYAFLSSILAGVVSPLIFICFKRLRF